MDFHFHSIGFIRSPYTEKFGIPRQPGLVSAAQVTLHLQPEFGPETCEGLEGFSHLWLQFVFHEHLERGWQARVRPPRLGGNQRMGVFATRSPFRPNPIGLSVVTLEKIDVVDGQVVLTLGGADLLDGTPIIDIKPYVPLADRLEDARGGFAQSLPPIAPVQWEESARAQAAKWQLQWPHFPTLIEQVLGQDPRPAYQREEGREYGMQLYHLNVRFRATAEGFLVLGIEEAAESDSSTDD